MITYKNTIPVKDYNEIRAAVGWQVLDAELAETGIRNSAYLIAAWDGDKPVGSARVISDGGYMALIVDVMVLPEYQGMGIGAVMLLDINKWLDDLAKDGRPLMINLMATTGNEKFYEKFGFVARPNEGMGAGMVRWINE